MLEEFQKANGETPHVYFNPPETVKMHYPCFVYHFNGYDEMSANDEKYLLSGEYAVRYISKSADPPIPKAMAQLSRVSYERHYTAENLHHFMFTIRTTPLFENVDVNLGSIASSFLGGNNG